ncbi:MAG: hypothetical protein AAB521_01360 [Patescibacteria group bacterium]
MTEQEVQVSPQASTHSHKVLYASLGLLLGSVVMLLVVVGMYYSKNKNSKSASEQNKTEAQAVPSEDQGFQAQMVESDDSAPITTKQELDTQLKTLDSTDTTAVEEGLDQNSQDASQFSQ